jgi:hypothetical protein
MEKRLPLRMDSKAGEGLLETYEQQVRDWDLSLGIVGFMGIFYDRPDVVDIQVKAVRFAVERLLRLHVVSKVRGIDPLVQTEKVIVQNMGITFL